MYRIIKRKVEKERTNDDEDRERDIESVPRVRGPFTLLSKFSNMMKSSSRPQRNRHESLQ